MAYTEDDEVMKLRHAIAELQQKNMALCGMLRDAIQLADLAIKLGPASGASGGRRLPGKVCSRKSLAAGIPIKPSQV